MCNVPVVLRSILLRTQLEPRAYVYGICAELDREGLTQSGRLQALFRAWPKYSGNPEYPVPWPAGVSTVYEGYSVPCRSPQNAYLWGVLKPYRWDASHPYGQLRRELAQFVIDNWVIPDVN